ncbi:hypothetical protein R3P38DRAFT_317238 [Favolaschia claudopus]|uniref:Uncharacterized protein n=1 Tax=Favolaschia claudopus TaxID=2862362 RepID=A0AAW0CRD2_9AGAR
MRLSFALLFLSTIGIVMARECVKCPKKVDGVDKTTEFHLAQEDPDTEETTFCGYTADGERHQGFCSYYNETGRISDASKHLACPNPVKVEECQEYLEKS